MPPSVRAAPLRRALWNAAHPSGKTQRGKLPPGAQKKVNQTFTLKKTRDGWVKDAYKAGTPAFRARTTLASEP
jgi:hypothetical protein